MQSNSFWYMRNLHDWMILYFQSSYCPSANANIQMVSSSQLGHLSPRQQLDMQLTHLVLLIYENIRKRSLHISSQFNYFVCRGEIWLLFFSVELQLNGK